MNKRCDNCGEPAKTQNAKYCGRCYKQKARTGTVKKKSSAYRDSTLKANEIRRAIRQKSDERDNVRKRTRAGSFCNEEGLQMKADVKVVNSMQHKETVIALRQLKPPRRYSTSRTLVYTQEERNEKDVWAIKLKPKNGQEYEANEQAFITARSRPPSRITNEAIFAVERTKNAADANAQISIDCDSTECTIVLDISKTVNKGQRILAYSED